MKNKFCIISLISAILCVCACGNFVYAQETPKDILTPDSLLINSNDASSIKTISNEILDMANSFEIDGFQAELSDIAFDDAYKIYVDTDVISSRPDNLQKLSVLLKQAKVVWNIPVYTQNQTVVVQVSKAPELREIDQSQLTNAEIAEAVEKAGKWQPVAATLYDANSDAVDILEPLSESNMDLQHEVILVGGEPGIQSVIALITEGNSITGAVSLERDITFAPVIRSRSSNETSEITLEQNKMYTLDKFEEAANSLLQNTDDVSDPTAGTKYSQDETPSVSKYFLLGGLIIGGLAIILLILRKVSRNFYKN